MPECSSIEQHPEQADAVILTFDERFQAEMVSMSRWHVNLLLMVPSFSTHHATFPTLEVRSSSPGFLMTLSVALNLRRPHEFKRSKLL